MHRIIPVLPCCSASCLPAFGGKDVRAVIEEEEYFPIPNLSFTLPFATSHGKEEVL